jgi:hypothetical protein
MSINYPALKTVTNPDRLDVYSDYTDLSIHTLQQLGTGDKESWLKLLAAARKKGSPAADYIQKFIDTYSD